LLFVFLFVSSQKQNDVVEQAGQQSDRSDFLNKTNYLIYPRQAIGKLIVNH